VPSERVTLAAFAPEPARAAKLSDRAALLDALLSNPMLAAKVPPGEAKALLIELARVTRALELLSVAAPLPVEEPADGSWLTVEDVIALTGLSRRQVYARAERAPRAHQTDWRPFAVREGKKTLRFRPALRRALMNGKPSRTQS